MNMSGTAITDINGNIVNVTNIDLLIKECDSCKNSPFVIFGTRHTEGENNRFLLSKLWKLKKEISHANRLKNN